MGDSPGSKAEKAAKLGVPIISEDELKHMLGLA
jgi:NAD-dependent DNA ligase